MDRIEPRTATRKIAAEPMFKMVGKKEKPEMNSFVVYSYPQLSMMVNSLYYLRNLKIKLVVQKIKDE